MGGGGVWFCFVGLFQFCCRVLGVLCVFVFLSPSERWSRYEEADF